MAGKSVIPDYDYVFGQMTNEIAQELNVKIDNYVQKLRKAVTKANKDFYLKLALLTQVSVAQRNQRLPPAHRLPEWPGLTPDYEARRNREYNVPFKRFFHRRGNLTDQITAMNPQVDVKLGQPLVDLMKGGKELRPGFKQKGSLFFDPRGKFASPKTVFQSLPDEIVITVFPNIKNREVVFSSAANSGLSEEAVFGNERFSDDPEDLKISWKAATTKKKDKRIKSRTRKGRKGRSGLLRNKLAVKGEYKRPFTLAVLDWWANNHVRRIVEKV